MALLTHQALHRVAPVLFSGCRGLPDDIPGPEPGRWFSTAETVWPWGRDSLGHAARLFREYGPVVALVRGGGTRHISADEGCPGTVLVYGPEHVRTSTSLHEVFSKANLSGALFPGNSPPPRKLPLVSFGAGLFAVNGDDHRRHRRLLMPAFSKRRLAAYCAVMVQHTEKELARWQAGERRDVREDMRRLTAAIVTGALFGRSAHSQTEAASRDLQVALALMGNPLTRVAPLDWPGLPYRRYLDATTRLRAHVSRIVRDRETPKRDRLPGRDDMLAALIGAHDEESNTRLSQDEILGHVSIFFAAGHETSANALAWTLLLLAQFPDVAERVEAEVDDVLGGQAPTPEALDGLRYLGWVVKESLRLFTPAPWNGRIVTEPVQMGDHVVPAGTEVLVSIYETHRMESIYPSRLAFRPSRWDAFSPSVHEYTPFSAGPRTCIGAAFATMEIKVVLAMLVQRYRLQLLDQRVDRFAEMVLAPKYPLHVRVAAKDGQHRRSRARLTGQIRDMVEGV